MSETNATKSQPSATSVLCTRRGATSMSVFSWRNIFSISSLSRTHLSASSQPCTPLHATTVKPILLPLHVVVPEPLHGVLVEGDLERPHEDSHVLVLLQVLPALDAPARPRDQGPDLLGLVRRWHDVAVTAPGELAEIGAAEEPLVHHHRGLLEAEGVELLDGVLQRRDVHDAAWMDVVEDRDAEVLVRHDGDVELWHRFEVPVVAVLQYVHQLRGRGQRRDVVDERAALLQGLDELLRELHRDRAAAQPVHELGEVLGGVRR